MNFIDIDIISKMEKNELERGLKLVFNPPITSFDLSESVRKKAGIVLPQQPITESIELSKIENALGNKALEKFLALDQVISLMPYNDYMKLKEKSDMEILFDWEEKIAKQISVIENLRSDDLRGEDSKREGILMLAVSNKQLNIVKGRHTEWVWREKALDGSDAPDAIKLSEDISRIANTLSENGVKTFVAIDSEIYDEAKNLFVRSKIFKVNVPENMAKIFYTRDQSVTWLKYPIIGNMSLKLRRGEEEVLNEIYYNLNIYPMARARWVKFDNMLVRAVMEGGNFFIIKTEKGVALLTGIGVRGSNYATFKFLGEILPEDVRIIGVPLAGYIKYWEFGAVHLDTAFAYLGDVGGERVGIIDPSRVGFYSALEYDRKSGMFRVTEILKLMKELEVKIDEMPRESQSPITMTNALNLGNGKLAVDSYNEKANEYIEKTYGLELLRIKIPQIEAGGGGVRCSTRELWELNK
ncbi:arginine deiminase family protein [Fervidicoccus sp.]|uniref:arginine deiminase family protein n=1 Tax=Fervidicoccus sp. TaxID=2060324 RepID=UPI003D0ED003